MTTDHAQLYNDVDYDNSSFTLPVPPVAVVAATTVNGDAPLPVSFDASGSSDADGTIASYQWYFGDGVTGTGITVDHTYASAGSYTATLTVTDDTGLQDTASVGITVTSAAVTVLNAPSGLTQKTAGRIVTLTWKDNATNESGFYVERAVKITNKTTSAFSRVLTTGPAAITVADTVPAKGTYYYRVQAFDSVTGQTTGYTNTVTANVTR